MGRHLLPQEWVCGKRNHLDCTESSSHAMLDRALGPRRDAARVQEKNRLVKS